MFCLAACCLGFLRYNMHPARIFMGDTGSMFLGYSHDVNIDPVGQYTKISTPDETHIVVEGCDKQEVGQTAALIYDSHRPDVYGNKGVHFKGQHMIKKVGKRAAAAAPAKK